MTGIFYGSATGSTEAVAQDIARLLGVAESDLHNVADASADEADKYDLLLLGSSTWGCGDSGCYPDTFCDAIGLLYEGLQGCGCTFIGSFEPQGYAATSSLVCSEGQFLGLAIDESAPEKTDARVAAWCRQLVSERQ